MQLATVLSVGAEKCSVSVQRSKSCTAISKIKYMKLVGKKQVWCGEGRNFNSLAIGGVGTDGLQWSISKNNDNKNQYFSKKDDVLIGFDIYFAVLSLVMSNYP